MSNDLISRKALIKNLMEEIPLAENVHIFKDIIENQPTAFDKEKVIEELESLSAEAREDWRNYDDKFAFGVMVAYQNAIRIVERGGVE